MDEFIKERFLKATTTLNEIYLIQNDKNITLSKLQKGICQAYDFAFSNLSNLHIFNDAICNYFGVTILTKGNSYDEKEKTKPIDKLKIKSLYVDLLSILDKNLNSNNFILTDYKIYFSKMNELEAFSYIYKTPAIVNTEQLIHQSKNNFNEIKSKTQGFIVLNNLLEAINNFINEILYFNIKRIFDSSDSKSATKLSFLKTSSEKNREEYINSWLDCSVTGLEWKKNFNYDFWEELEYIIEDEEEREKIESHQLGLFYEEVKLTVDRKFSAFEHTAFNKKKNVIERELELIKNFTNGDLSDITIKRLNKIINFEEPEKVLIEYDEVIKHNYFDPYSFYILNKNKFNSYTTFFIAHFISAYIQKLENELKKFPSELPINNGQTKEVKETKIYFKIIAGASKKNKATALFEALEKGKHVDITSKNDFINAFIGNAPTNKINWIGMFGDLKSFINYSISENLIENVNMKWVVTSNIFTHNSIHFNNKTIKDTEITSGDNKIKKLVKSIF